MAMKGKGRGRPALRGLEPIVRAVVRLQRLDITEERPNTLWVTEAELRRLLKRHLVRAWR